MAHLAQAQLAPDTGGGAVDLAYDYAGNLLRQQLQSGGALRYTHDAWNRLVDQPSTITSIGMREWAHIGQE